MTDFFFWLFHSKLIVGAASRTLLNLRLRRKHATRPALPSRGRRNQRRRLSAGSSGWLAMALALISTSGCAPLRGYHLLWTDSTGRVFVYEADSAHRIASLCAPFPNARATSVDASPNSLFVLWSTRQRSSVQEYCLSSGKLVSEMDEPYVVDLAITPSGGGLSYLVAGVDRDSIDEVRVSSFDGGIEVIKVDTPSFTWPLAHVPPVKLRWDMSSLAISTTHQPRPAPTWSLICADGADCEVLVGHGELGFVGEGTVIYRTGPFSFSCYNLESQKQTERLAGIEYLLDVDSRSRLVWYVEQKPALSLNPVATRVSSECGSKRSRRHPLVNGNGRIIDGETATALVEARGRLPTR